LAIPAIVRRKALSLKSSAASTIASSGSDSRRRIGSSTTGSTSDLRESPSSAATRPRRLRLPVVDDRRGRAALLQPAVLERDVLAERAHVDEVLAVVRVAHRALADEQ
jgi:hypothetical protein